MWTTAVWREETMEMDEVIPSCRVKNGGVFWPTQGDVGALKDCKEPEESWTKFPLIKIKIQSGMCFVRQRAMSYECKANSKTSTQTYGDFLIFLFCMNF
jgi:hypothetical protein